MKRKRKRTVDVLLAVDVEGALASKNLYSNIYLMDTSKFFSSYQEGQPELVTILGIGNTIVWSVVPIDPGTNVVIQNFRGQAVKDNVINPVVDPIYTQSFESRFLPAGYTPSGTRFRYRIDLDFEGKTVMGFDPFLQLE